MTSPASGKDDLRKKLVIILGNALYSGKSLDQVSKIPKKELAKWESAIDEIMQLIAQHTQQAVQKALDLGEQSPWQVTVGSGTNNINIHLTHPKDVAEYGRAFRAIEHLAALTAAQARKDERGAA